MPDSEFNSARDNTFIVNHDNRDLGLDLTSIDYNVDIFDNDEDDGLSADVELIQRLKDEYAESGYAVQDLNYEDLSTLQKRELEFNESNYKDLFNKLYSEKYKKILESLTSSRATSIKAENARRMEAFSLSVQRPEGIDENFEELVLSLLKMLQDKETTMEFVSITAQNIIELICRSPEKDTYIRLVNYGVAVDEYIDSCVKQFIGDLKNKLAKFQESELKRRKTAEYLLAREKRNLKILQDSNCRPIKRLQKVGNTLKYVCPHCSNLVELNNSFISIIAIASEHKRFDRRGSKFDDTRHLYEAFGFPEVEICPYCNGNSMLWWQEYEQLSEESVNYYNNNLAEVNAYLYNISEGTAFIRIIPKREIIEKVLFYLIETSGDVSTSTKIVERIAPINYSDEEYYDAIAKFYDRVKGIKAQSTPEKFTEDATDIFNDDIRIVLNDKDYNEPDHLSYKTLARYFSRVLSQDYIELKNKAFCSVLYKLEEFPSVVELLNQTNLITLKNRKAFLDICTSERFIMTLDYDNELQKLYSELYHEGLLDTETYSFDALKDFAKVLPNLIKKRELQLKSLKSQLFNLESALSYIRIINLRQVPVKDFYSYFSDVKLFEFFDRVTDRMIILYLAKSYCDMLFKQKTINSTTANAIASITNTDIVYKKVFAVLNNYDCLSEEEKDSIGQKVSRISLKHLEPINKMVEAFKQYDYFNFIQAVYDITDNSTLTDCVVDTELKHLIQYVKHIQPKLSSQSEYAYYLFYLQQYTEEDFEQLDNDSRRLLQQIKFHRFILRPFKTESLQDYIQRYTEMESEDKISNKNSFDCLSYFEPYKDFFGIMLIANIAYLLECDDYALTIFINELANCCVQNHNKADSIHMLGMDQSLVQKIENKKVSIVNTNSLENFLKYYTVISGYYASFNAYLFEDYLAKLEVLSIPVDRSLYDQDYDFDVNLIRQKIENLRPEDFIALNESKQSKAMSVEGIADKLDTMGLAVEDLAGIKEDMLSEITEDE